MSPETIDAMLAAGATAEVIAAAWKAEIAKQERALEERRSKDRDRQRRHRESRDVTVTNSDTALPDVTPCSLEVSPHTPLPNPITQSPLSPPIQEEKLRAVGSCLKKAYQVEIPDWMPESFAEFRAMRKRMRNVPFEPGAERRCIAKLTRLRSEGHDPEKLLSKAIENGHRTFFPDETTKADRKAMPEQVRENQLGLAALYDRMGRTDEADEIRRRYAASIGDVAGAIVKSVRAA